MKTINAKPAVIFYLAGLVLIHIALFWNLRHLVRMGYPDFTIYYSAGRIVRQGLGHQLYNDQTQFRVQREFAKEVRIRQGPLPFNHPAFEALLFASFTYFPYPAAFALWDLLNLAMLAALPFLLRPHLPKLQSYSWSFWMLAMLAFSPIFFALLQGQDAILLLFLYTLAFVCLKKHHEAWAGCWLALGSFKFHLVVPFVLLSLVQGRKKLFYGFMTVASALAVVSLVVVGKDAMIWFPSYVLHLEGAEAGGISPSAMPNLRGLLNMVLASNAYSVVVVVVISLGVILFSAWQCRANDSSNLFDLKFSLAAFATVLVSYHAMDYDLSMLMLPTLLMANELRGGENFVQWPSWLMICAGTVLFFSPMQLLLVLRYRHLALMGLAVLLCMCGIAGQISLRTRHDLSSYGTT
jgi:Glycosyltransferase family 87